MRQGRHEFVPHDADGQSTSTKTARLPTENVRLLVLSLMKRDDKHFGCGFGAHRSTSSREVQWTEMIDAADRTIALERVGVMRTRPVACAVVWALGCLLGCRRGVEA